MSSHSRSHCVANNDRAEFLGLLAPSRARKVARPEAGTGADSRRENPSVDDWEHYRVSGWDGSG